MTKDELIKSAKENFNVSLNPKDKLKDLATFKAGQIANPLVGKFTTKPIAQALENANNLTEGYFTAAVRGKEGASVAEKGASFLYRNLLLFLR